MPRGPWAWGSGMDEIRRTQVENAVIELIQQVVDVVERVEALEKKVAELDQAQDERA